MIYSQFDVVIVPFPFTEKDASKRRPALVLSGKSEFNEAAGHSVMAMITTASHSSWPLDIRLSDLESTGLKVASIVRMKLFTIDHTLIRERIGSLGTNDQVSVRAALSQLLRLALTVKQETVKEISEERAGTSET